MIEPFVENLSTYGHQIDNLILFVAVLVGFWFLLAQGIFFWLMWKFRASQTKRADYITGEKPEEMRWISIPHTLVLICDVFIIVGAIMVWVNIKQTLPEPDLTIGVVAQQWAWTFVHPGEDRILNTDDDITMIDELHVQAGLTYHFQLESRDVLHDFSVPVFRLKQDVIPGRRIVGWFEVPDGVADGGPLEHDVQCAEMCGIGHGLMAARIIIENEEDHQRWINAPSHLGVSAIANAE